MGTTQCDRGVPAEPPGGQGWTMAIDKLEALAAELSDSKPS